MAGHPNRAATIFLSTVIAVLSVIVVSLAIPLQVWRSGRLEAPPLDLVSGGQLVSRSSRIWIDTDAACGATPTTDPDDCLAIVWLAAKGHNIVGISTSYGNASADIVERTTEALVATMGNGGLPRIPVWRGAAGFLANSGKATQPAHAVLRAELEQGPLTILALGPLTNVAAALEGRPDLQRNVARLIAVMGHRPGHIFHPSEGSGRGMLLGHGPIFRDLNFAKDEVAARSVLRMRLPVTLVSYDAARQVRITADDLDRLTRLGPAFAWVASRARGWLDYWHVDIGQPGFSPFDWVAAAYVVEPGLFGCAVTDAWIEDEWVFWLYPRPSLLVGPATPVNVTVKAEVIYCPQANPSLHGYLLSGEMPFVPGFWDRRGWGCGLSYITRHDDVAAVPGWWDGGWARPGNRTSSRK
ncbi:MAG: nucleoside hydrolase [Gammaproteobacteria bacterium]